MARPGLEVSFVSQVERAIRLARRSMGWLLEHPDQVSEIVEQAVRRDRRPLEIGDSSTRINFQITPSSVDPDDLALEIIICAGGTEKQPPIELGRVSFTTTRLLVGRAQTRQIPLADNPTPEMQDLARQVQELMSVDKIYRESRLSRADLARELNVGENALSFTLNHVCGRSFHQLRNSYRVEEAKSLLLQTDLLITQIGYDVGFNSLASFNRVFRAMADQSPTEFRATAGGVPASILPRDRALDVLFADLVVPRAE